MNDEEFDSKEYRDEFVAANIRNGIAFQIRAMRQKANLSQSELAQRAGKTQNVISRLEDPDYGRFTLNTLLDLAKAFDVALVVRFASFSELRASVANLTPSALEIPSYAEEAAASRRKLARLKEQFSNILLVHHARDSGHRSILGEAETKSLLKATAFLSGTSYGSALNEARTGDLSLPRARHESTGPRHMANTV